MSKAVLGHGSQALSHLNSYQTTLPFLKGFKKVFSKDFKFLGRWIIVMQKGVVRDEISMGKARLHRLLYRKTSWSLHAT